ncbi:MAG: PorT family protein [Bacteroidetes bacterium]|nr:PorT family protein [Bacteroidota bacterium]
MQSIHRYKIIFCCLLLLPVYNAHAQWFKRTLGGEIDPLRYERAPFHMGFSIVGDYGKFKIVPVESLLSQDSLLSIRTQGFPGIGFGGIMNLRLSKHWHIRALPQLNFNQRNVFFEFRDRTDMIEVESITFDIPVLIKYQGTRHNNYNMYVIGGVRPSHDFSAKQDKQRGPLIKQVALRKQSISYEFGFGFDIYTTYFKFSPEIKMSNSITNVISKDSYIYNGSINFLQTRLFQISFHFE